MRDRGGLIHRTIEHKPVAALLRDISVEFDGAT
jgi:hypothetical protein